MSGKRRNSSSPELDYELTTKRIAHSTAGASSDDDNYQQPFRDRENPKHCLSTGQVGAFPGLDHDDDELFYGPPSDGIEYLRMVRSEARGVPSLLVAPGVKRNASNVIRGNESAQEHDSDELRYNLHLDDAYIAQAAKEHIESDTTSRPSVQAIYHEAFSARYHVLRAILKCTPPSQITEFPPAQAYSRSLSLNYQDRKQWAENLRVTNPNPKEIAYLHAGKTLEIVKMLVDMIGAVAASRSNERIARFSAWVWAILGKCPEPGELDSEEVAELRMLGKRAVSLQSKLQQSSESARRDEFEIDAGKSAEEVHNNLVGEDKREEVVAPVLKESSVRNEVLEEAKIRLSAGLKDAVIDNPVEAMSKSCGKKDFEQKVRVLLDMIITVVGEFYGQRDLLEHREKWSANDEV